jgi:hypothetical protein
MAETIDLHIGVKQGQFEELERHLYEGKYATTVPLWNRVTDQLSLRPEPPSVRQALEPRRGQ